MVSLYDVVRLLEDISQNLSDYSNTHIYSNGIHRLRYKPVLCAFTCQLLCTLDKEYYEIVKHIYKGEYPSLEKEWYLIEGFIYIGDIELTNESVFTSIEGLADVVNKNNSYSYPVYLWEGLTDETIIRLLKDTNPYVQLFGCQYFQYVLSMRIDYNIPSSIIKYIIYLLDTKYPILMIEVLTIVDSLLFKKIKKLYLIQIKISCMTRYLKEDNHNVLNRLWHTIHRLKRIL